MSEPDDFQRQFGIKRRSRPGGEAKPADAAAAKDDDELPPAVDTTPLETEEKPAEKPHDEKEDRRARVEAARAARSGSPPSGSSPPSRAKKEEEDAPAAPAGPIKVPASKLKEPAGTWLKNFLKTHAGPPIQLPALLDELDGTHGMYLGNGVENREIVFGWKPAYVVFTIPLYHDDVPHPIPPKMVEYHYPPLHAQPEPTAKGFLTGKLFNKRGMTYMYVAWKHDGRDAVPKPVAEPEDEKPRDRRGRPIERRGR